MQVQLGQLDAYQLLVLRQQSQADETGQLGDQRVVVGVVDQLDLAIDQYVTPLVQGLDETEFHAQRIVAYHHIGRCQSQLIQGHRLGRETAVAVLRQQLQKGQDSRLIGGDLQGLGHPPAAVLPLQHDVRLALA